MRSSVCITSRCGSGFVEPETDAGQRPGLTSDERDRMKELEREVKELRRANEILKSASVFFATELDGRTKK